MGSDAYFDMFKKARQLYQEGKINYDLDWFDEEILRDTQLGEWEHVAGVGMVPLDMIIDEANHQKHLEEEFEEPVMYGIIRYPDTSISYVARYDDQWQHLYDPSYGYSGEVDYDDLDYLEVIDKDEVPIRLTIDDYFEEVSSEAGLDEAEYQGKDVDLNKPKRGGSKKFYVYTKNPKTGKVIKVSFGAKDGGGNLAVKLKDPKARKAFADRHDCENKKDKTKAGYWSCRLPRYAKTLGLSGGGTWW